MMCLDYVYAAWYAPVLTVLAGYLLGSISFAIIVTRLFAHRDIRDFGSGNAGATNVLRSQGKLPAALTALFDVVKGVVSALIGGWLLTALCGGDAPDAAREELWYLGCCTGGIAAELGHLFPLYFGFRGGKGVLTSLGFALVLDWRVGLLVVGVFAVAVALTRMVSVGSLAAALSAVVLTWVFFDAVRGRSAAIVWLCTGTIAVAALLILIKHAANIRRILHGNENTLSFGGKPKTQNTDTK